MSMPAVLTTKVLLFVNVIVGILEMDLIVPVSLSFGCLKSKIFTFLLIVYFFVISIFF